MSEPTIKDQLKEEIEKYTGLNLNAKMIGRLSDTLIKILEKPAEAAEEVRLESEKLKNEESPEPKKKK